MWDDCEVVSALVCAGLPVDLDTGDHCQLLAFGHRDVTVRWSNTECKCPTTRDRPAESEPDRVREQMGDRPGEAWRLDTSRSSADLESASHSNDVEK